MEVSLEGVVVLQDIKREDLADALFHGIDVEREELSVFVPASEQFQGFVLGRAAEPEIGDVILRAPEFHLPDNPRVHIGYFRVVIIGALVRLYPPRQRCPEVARRLAGLGGVDFVNNHGEGFAFEFADGLGNHVEFLYGGDDDVLAGFQEASELRRVLVNAVNDALHLLRLLDGLLELLVEHAPIGDHNHRVEDALRIRR